MRPLGLFRLVAVVLLLAVCVPCFLVTRAFGKGDFWVRTFLARMGWLLGLRVRVVGRPLPANVLFAANHSSWLDILTLGGEARARFIAKSEIEGWGLVGTLARLAGSVFVSRDRRSATRAQADAVALALREGRPVALFAEGGTGDGVLLDPFRPALFAAAVEAGSAVQPVAIDYGTRNAEMAWPDGMRFSEEMKRILNRPGRIDVTIHFMPALDARALGRKELAGRAQAAVADALGRPLRLAA
ncbi:lysophospholipid acyltransferase family protein [Sphingomonas nostoxanthinifaciens]|uniref:lysophospholipid acyltransferase family protein n=1 Tax=Sphingomonas nostoxanthinifaciens TaxID=2872652 RepID=UPI001CC1E469|nr:lysophospholipid acyltransferase family protein [Sphingomonas nostoxanthinifaciens]UAK24804.1 1-acyl-sn-glycerol-3-phosphate acyltransferase [Sphingomonas nostoxanthinifaciens]